MEASPEKQSRAKAIPLSHSRVDRELYETCCLTSKLRNATQSMPSLFEQVPKSEPDPKGPQMNTCNEI